MSNIYYPGIFVVGWIAAALINYLCDVLPETRRFSRIICLHCHQTYPIVDYLLMKPCPTCSKWRKIRAWAVLILFVCIAILLALFSLGRLGFWIGLLLLIYFGVVSVIDIEHRIIMHPVSIAGALIGICIGLWQHGLVATLIGGFAGLGIMLGVYFTGMLFSMWISKKRKTEFDEDAFGFGDVALSGVLGLLLGWPGIAGGLILAILFGGTGSLFVMVYALFTKRFHSFMTIPYGPFLILGAAILIYRPGV